MTGERAVVKRRQRTRQFVELGGLIAKAELIELTKVDCAVILVIVVTAVAMLRSEDRDQALVSWRRRGKWAFDQSADIYCRLICFETNNCSKAVRRS